MQYLFSRPCPLIPSAPSLLGLCLLIDFILIRGHVFLLILKRTVF